MSDTRGRGPTVLKYPTVPRDEAFWNTYHEVQREFHQAELRAECEYYGHTLVSSNMPGDAPHCERCDLSGDEVIAEWKRLGYIRGVRT